VIKPTHSAANGRRFSVLVPFLALFLALPGCSDAGHSNATSGGVDATGVKLVLTGSSTVAPLASEIGKRFEALYPGARVDVQTGGSSRGIADVSSGRANIGMASRALHPKESALFAHTIAQDGISIILHRDNPIKKLSHQQVIDIYTGKITRWTQVGGADLPITVVNKSEGHSTLGLFLHYYKLKGSQVKAHVVIGDNEQGIKTVAGNPGAIGYVSIGTAAYDAAHGVAIQLLPIDGVEATIDAVASGRFPFARPLNFVTTEEPTGWNKRFIDFARSPEVRDLVKAQYFVPVGPSKTTDAEHGSNAG